MPLPAAAARTPIHRRKLSLCGYRRDDGLWDLEGRLCDTKDEPFQVNVGPLRQPGEMIHDMTVRVTVDLDYNVVAAISVSDTTPYVECPTVADAIGNLVGLNLLRGWRDAVNARMGGVRGCSHLTEVLRVLPSLAVQSMVAYRRHLPEAKRANGTPVMFESCRAYARTAGATARRWPELVAALEAGEAAAGRAPVDGGQGKDGGRAG